MNLLELMLKKEIEWPVGAKYAAQDGNMTLRWYAEYPAIYNGRQAWGTDGMCSDKGVTMRELANYWDKIVVAREEYQAAGGKITATSDDVAPLLSASSAAIAKQSAPKGSGSPILGMVLADLTNRALEGTAKYGEPLKARNGRNPLWDAYQEALDLAMYLRQAIEEQQ